MIPSICGCPEILVAPPQVSDRVKSVAIGVLSGLVMLGIMVGSLHLIMKRFPNLKIGQDAQKLFKLCDKYPVLKDVWRGVMGILATVGAPLIEETCFRGYIDANVQKYSGDNNLAKKIMRVVLVALLFGACHLSPFQSKASNLMIFGATSILGLGFGILKEARGDLLTPMSAHATYNLGAMLAV